MSCKEDKNNLSKEAEKAITSKSFSRKRLPQARDVFEGVGNLLLLFQRDSIEERQGQCAMGDGIGDWEMGGECAGAPLPGGLKVDGREITACRDSVFGENGLDLVAIGMCWTR